MCSHVLRFVFIASFVILFAVWFSVLVNAQYFVDKRKALTDQALYGHAFRNLTMETVGGCFSACVKDCRCMTFQMCKNMTECQLLSSNQFRTPSALKALPKCSYYDMFPVQQDSSTKPIGCSSARSCCKDSNPCLNGGICEAVFPTDYTTRFRCNCPAGYTGNLCQYPIKSCRGYINGTRIPGKYKVFNAEMKLFEVFCDFDVNSTMAWTLIQSYQLQNNSDFQAFPLHQNHPVHEDSVVWDSYRLSKPRMEFIRDDSSKWRVTCRYDTDGISYTDYVRASIGKIDILTYDEPGQCKEVEYIDIRGQKCSSQPCKILVYQKSNILHINSYKKKCNFQPTDSKSCGGRGEDNFGYYVCINPAHRCSASPTSTTQTWFGSE